MASPLPSPPSSPDLPMFLPAPNYIPRPEVGVHLLSDQSPEPALAAADGGGDGGEQGNNAFAPSDQELVCDYLVRRVLEQPTPVDVITEIELYKVDPDQLPRNYPYDKEGGSRYFFSPRETYGRQSRTKRTTPGGRWKKRGTEKRIKDHKRTLIGFKRNLDFFRGDKGKERVMTNWRMAEFRLNTDLEVFKNRDNAKALVLCKVTEMTNSRDAEQGEGSGCGPATHDEQEEVDI